MIVILRTLEYSIKQEEKYSTMATLRRFETCMSLLASALSRPIASRNPTSNAPTRQTRGVAGGVVEGRSERIKWLWEADASEVMIAVGHSHGSRQVGGIYTLNTVKPLRPEHVERALVHLQRQTQALRGVIKVKNGKYWICESDQDQINFEVQEGGDIMQEMWRFTNMPLGFDQAPLWRAVFMPGNGSDGDASSASGPSHLQEVRARFPHQSRLALPIHHSFVGGPTMPLITQRLVELLNDVLAGRPIDDSRQLGVLVPSTEIDAAKRRIREELERDPARLEALKEETLACDSEPILLKAFPRPGGAPSSGHVFRDVSPALLQKFTAKCKSEGVTFNSGLQAVINTALVEVVTEAGLQQDTFSLSINLATDLRRYMNRNPLEVLGLHVRPTVHRVATPARVRDCFWQYCRAMHGPLSGLIRSGLALQQEVVREMTQRPVDLHHFYKNPPPVVRDYGLASVGDLTSLIRGEGDHLQLTDILMTSASHRIIYPMLHQIYTFRGLCPYSVGYDTSYMSHDTASSIADKVLSTMADVSEF
ncbi:uncharacterized protein LOC122265203 [Penaeus japonicus]|uniref:uncharacterized protein LOC122265203 n=1 Tax=Penaeus japonicus TaxID=27405 RepID=UPI001C70FE91|nr:uncharacterized protein LOC122265203 [Penaeus japonicus]